ncbi:MAG: class I SAM-dependent methyltransferase [Methanocalculus sp. MSAO_Arc1]|uniref:class I SAM-dependent methyltransferase n=1 Tax=Methanocalculus TaxID=71151 RepID=UPI000FED5150|nr:MULTISPECIES: class I SAM-dependent methyltransferase [unclassified Methanocalculus]MCP1662456.1 ubiquinone/menaquinone biosynthesis C-methylase UbiE/uncharacterized protein YbaR (Trm112 family) [Methanocalculus sp. AMF5]RQD80887.1 MAG: class I SAM-dependent methyltransferase [Methanocalculus sp. MSAO_Arc1]
MNSFETRQQELYSLLQNPATKNSLAFEGTWVADSETGERFPIRDGIPVVLREDDLFGWNKKMQRGYSWFSHLYDLLYATNLGNIQKWLDELAGIIDITDGDAVLETSVGTGQQIRNLARSGVSARFFGNDITFGMLRKCQHNCRKWGIDSGLVQGNAETLPFQDGIFDVVFHIGGINFFNEKEAAIQEMIRVAKPGASIYLSDESAAFQEKTPIGSFMPKAETGVYDPPVNLISDSMLNCKTYELWDSLFWMVSFEKPE